MSTIDSRIDALSAEQARTRRENVRNLVPAAEQLVNETSAALRAAEADVVEREAAYQRRHGSIARLTRGLFGNAASSEWKASVAPAKTTAANLSAAKRRADALRAEIAAEAVPVETRTSYRTGICGVYNEDTGKVEWRTAYNTGVAGAYDPNKREVVWATQYEGGAAAIYDPTTRSVKTETSYHTGLTTYLDPATQRPKVERAYGHGLASVVDNAGKVHVQRTYHSGVSGYKDADGTARFTVPAYNTGVATVYRDGDTYRSSCSFAPYDDD